MTRLAKSALIALLLPVGLVCLYVVCCLDEDLPITARKRGAL